MLSGENGIITQAQEAKENSRGAEIKEKVEMAANENKMVDYSTGTKKEKQDVIDELVADEKLTNKEVEMLETTDVITIGEIVIDLREHRIVRNAIRQHTRNRQLDKALKARRQ